MATSTNPSQTDSRTDPSAPTGVQDREAPSDLHDRVAQRAYELYLERGSADGGDFDDWLAAERELIVNEGRAPTEDRDE